MRILINVLRFWLMERGYNEKVIPEQILRAQEHSRNNLLEREKPQMSEQKLTFSINYYPAFQNVRTIMEELHILLTPNKEHKKVFPNAPVIGFQNIGYSQSEQQYPNLTRVEDVNHVGKTCLVCDSISTATTFTTEACYETFKIHSVPLTCDSENVLYLLKCKVCGEVFYVGKAKTKF